MLILGLILISIGIVGIVISYIVAIVDLKKRKDINEKLDRWCEHNKAIHIPIRTIEPDHFKIEKLYSKDFILNCPKGILRTIVKQDFGKALMDRLEEYLVVTNDYNEPGDQRVSIDIWVSKEE